MNQMDTEWTVVMFLSSLGLNGVIVPTEREEAVAEEAA